MPLGGPLKAKAPKSAAKLDESAANQSLYICKGVRPPGAITASFGQRGHMRATPTFNRDVVGEEGDVLLVFVAMLVLEVTKLKRHATWATKL